MKFNGEIGEDENIRAAGCLDLRMNYELAEENARLFENIWNIQDGKKYHTYKKI